MNEETKQAILSALRSILIAAGSALTAKGYIDDLTVSSVVGATMVIIPAIWGVLNKINAEKAAKEREVVALNAGIVIADATVGKTNPVSSASTPAVLEAVAATTPTPAASPFVTVTRGKGIAKP